MNPAPPQALGGGVEVAPELAGGQHVAQQRGQHDKAHQQHERVGDAKVGHRKRE